MLLFLNDLLNTPFRLGRITIYIWHILFIGYIVSVRNRESIFMKSDLWFYIPLFILVYGYLNEPYRYVINRIRIFLNKKLFRRRFVMIDMGIISFSNKKAGFWNLGKSIVGVTCESNIYLDSGWGHLKFNGAYNVIECGGLGDFLNETEFVDSEDIDKKLTVFRLGVSG